MQAITNVGCRVGFEVTVEKPIGECDGQSPMEKDGKLFFFFAKGGQGHLKNAR